MNQPVGADVVAEPVAVPGLRFIQLRFSHRSGAAPQGSAAAWTIDSVAARTRAYWAVAAILVLCTASWPGPGARLWHPSRLALVTRTSCVLPLPRMPEDVAAPRLVTPIPQMALRDDAAAAAAARDTSVDDAA